MENTLPKRNNGNSMSFSIRLDEDLKSKQVELCKANINVSRIVRDAIESAWSQLHGTSPNWVD